MEWSKFKQAYKNEGIVLVLGAGVSLKSKIPLWEELIRGMVLKMGALCDELQGYLFARPMPADELATWLGARAAAGGKPPVELPSASVLS